MYVLLLCIKYLYFHLGLDLEVWKSIIDVTLPLSKCIYNPIQQRGFWQCLPFSWTTLRGKHCRQPVAVNRVVDTAWPSLCLLGQEFLELILCIVSGSQRIFQRDLK